MSQDEMPRIIEIDGTSYVVGLFWQSFDGRETYQDERYERAREDNKDYLVGCSRPAFQAGYASSDELGGDWSHPVYSLGIGILQSVYEEEGHTSFITVFELDDDEYYFLSVKRGDIEPGPAVGELIADQETIQKKLQDATMMGGTKTWDALYLPEDTFSVDHPTETAGITQFLRDDREVSFRTLYGLLYRRNIPRLRPVDWYEIPRDKAIAMTTLFVLIIAGWFGGGYLTGGSNQPIRSAPEGETPEGDIAITDPGSGDPAPSTPSSEPSDTDGMSMESDTESSGSLQSGPPTDAPPGTDENRLGDINQKTIESLSLDQTFTPDVGGAKQSSAAFPDDLYERCGPLFNKYPVYIGAWQLTNQTCTPGKFTTTYTANSGQPRTVLSKYSSARLQSGSLITIPTEFEDTTSVQPTIQDTVDRFDLLRSIRMMDGQLQSTNRQAQYGNLGESARTTILEAFREARGIEPGGLTDDQKQRIQRVFAKITVFDYTWKQPVAPTNLRDLADRFPGLVVQSIKRTHESGSFDWTIQAQFYTEGAQ